MFEQSEVKKFQDISSLLRKRPPRLDGGAASLFAR